MLSVEVSNRSAICRWVQPDGILIEANIDARLAALDLVDDDLAAGGCCRSYGAHGTYGCAECVRTIHPRLRRRTEEGSGDQVLSEADMTACGLSRSIAHCVGFPRMYLRNLVSDSSFRTTCS